MANTPIVWAVHQPTGRDPETGVVRPSMSLEPARRWGELRFIFRPTENPFADINKTVDLICSTFRHDLRPDDYLLLVGNPVLIGLTAAAAAQQLDVLRVLQWQRTKKEYALVTLDLYAPLSTLAEA